MSGCAGHAVWLHRPWLAVGPPSTRHRQDHCAEARRIVPSSRSQNLCAVIDRRSKEGSNAISPNHNTGARSPSPGSTGGAVTVPAMNREPMSAHRHRSCPSVTMAVDTPNLSSEPLIIHYARLTPSTTKRWRIENPVPTAKTVSSVFTHTRACARYVMKNRASAGWSASTSAYPVPRTLFLRGWD